LQNNGDRFAKSGDDKLRLLAQWLGVAVFDENGRTAGGPGAVHIPPAIADQKTSLQVDSVLGGGARQHAGLGFPAVTRFAMIAARMITNLDRVQPWQNGAKLGVHRLDRFAALSSTPDIGLVGDYNENKAGLLQSPTAIRRVGIKREFVDVRWRGGEAFADYRPIEDAIAIEKDRTFSYFVLSHFVCAVFSAGCETSKCHTTAWNASEWGVVFMGFTVGMMMQTSATCAV